MMDINFNRVFLEDVQRSMLILSCSLTVKEENMYFLHKSQVRHELCKKVIHLIVDLKHEYDIVQ